MILRVRALSVMKRLLLLLVMETVPVRGPVIVAVNWERSHRSLQKAILWQTIAAESMSSARR